ncbi:MAG: molybdate ABC transporter permease subunit [Oligoflexales bacterium]
MPINELSSISLLSLKVSLCALLSILAPGISIGWWLSHKKGPLVSIGEAILLLPMVLPPSSCGLLLLTILSPEGILGGLLFKYFGINLLLNWKAAVVAAAFVSFPLLMRACQQSFAQIPDSLEELAKSFGLTKRQTFTQVTIPLALPGITNGCVLAVARSLGEFGSTIMVAGLIPGQTETLSLAIYARTINGRDTEAWTLALVSLVLSFVLLLTNRLYQKRSQNGLNAL